MILTHFEMDKPIYKWTCKCVFYSLFSELTIRRNYVTLYSFVFSIKSLFQQNPCVVVVFDYDNEGEGGGWRVGRTAHDPGGGPRIYLS
jgi:hypothetical protein